MTIWNKIRTGQWIPRTYLLMLVFNLLYNSLIYYGEFTEKQEFFGRKNWAANPVFERSVLHLFQITQSPEERRSKDKIRSEQAMTGTGFQEQTAVQTHRIPKRPK